MKKFDLLKEIEKLGTSMEMRTRQLVHCIKHKPPNFADYDISFDDDGIAFTWLDGDQRAGEQFKHFAIVWLKKYHPELEIDQMEGSNTVIGWKE
jgi:hypothetical protein